MEAVRPGWRWIAYSLPDARRVRNFAWIGPERKHIHLGFEHGTLLADPDRLLHGAEERLRKFRYFTFEPEIDIDEAILVDFIRRAADVAVMSARDRRAIAEAGLEPVDDSDIPGDIDIELIEGGCSARLRELAAGRWLCRARPASRREALDHAARAGHAGEHEQRPEDLDRREHLAE